MKIEYLGTTTRPWGQFAVEEALPFVARHFHKIQFMRHAGRSFLTPEETPEERRQALDLARENALEIASVIAWKPPLDEGAETAGDYIARYVDLAADAGAASVMLIVGSAPSTRDVFVEAVKRAADRAEEKDIWIGMKNHGFLMATGRNMRDICDAIDSPKVGLWFDPGNFVFYDGLDPVEEVKPIAEKTFAMMIKDCERGEDGKPNVMLRPGSGTVDFEGCFRELAVGGFRGPVLFETMDRKDASLDRLDEAAELSKEFIHSLVDAV